MATTVDEYAAAAILTHLLPLRLVVPKLVATPAAGAEFVAQVPGGCVWEILSLRATFTASAAVANRRPALRITDADDVEFQRYNTRVDIAAAGVANYNFVAGLGFEDTVEPSLYGLPNLPAPLQQGWKIQSLTSAKDVADTWTGVRMIVREWAADRIAQVIASVESDIFGLFDQLDTDDADS